MRGNRYVAIRRIDGMVLSLMAPHGIQIPAMMSLLRQPMVVVNSGNEIQMNTIDPYTRRFFRFSYKTPIID